MCIIGTGKLNARATLFWFVCFSFFFFYGYLSAVSFHNFYCNIKLEASNKIIPRLIGDISICSVLRSGLFHLVENVFLVSFENGG